MTGASVAHRLTLYFFVILHLHRCGFDQGIKPQLFDPPFICSNFPFMLSSYSLRPSVPTQSQNKEPYFPTLSRNKGYTLWKLTTVREFLKVYLNSPSSGELRYTFIFFKRTAKFAAGRRIQIHFFTFLFTWRIQTLSKCI